MSDNLTRSPAHESTPGEDTAVAHGQALGFPGVTSLAQARRMADQHLERMGNVRPVITGPLADQGVVEALMETPALKPCRLTCQTCHRVSGRDLPYDLTAPDACDHCGSSFRKEAEPEVPPFAVSTGDPRFNPARAVLINGFEYRPHRRPS